MIQLSAQCLDAIRTEGEKAYPNECCGALLGVIFDDDKRLVQSIFPITNAREQTEQYHRFEIEPEDLLRVEKEARSQNRDVIGFYHSHPDHPARPSEYDRNNAFPFYSYLIVSVEKKKAAALTSWRLSDDRKEIFEEVVEEVTMAVIIQIPTALRGFTERKHEVEVEAQTVGEAISALAGKYPDLRQHLYQGENLRSFINVFVGDTNIKKLEGLDTKLSGNETVMLVPAIAGGV